jgi:hypothetical protein
MKKTHYSMTELATAAGVTPQKLYYAILKGAVPAGKKHGWYRRYTARQAEQVISYFKTKEAK